MTGAYMRIERDGKWDNIEVEYLTDEEREACFLERDPVELVRWINMLCGTVCCAEQDLQKIAEECLPQYDRYGNIKYVYK